MPYHVYAIYSSKLDLIYIGQSSHIEERISDHNRGYSTFTSRTNDWILIYCEECDSKKNALKREKQLKSFKGREFIRNIIDKKL